MDFAIFNAIIFLSIKAYSENMDVFRFLLLTKLIIFYFYHLKIY